MKNLKSIIGLVLIIVTCIACGQNVTERKDTIVCLDIEKNIGFKNSKNLKPDDLKIVQLEKGNSDFDFKNSRILDVSGDTVFMLNNDFISTKIIMFSLSTGKYIGSINHQGEGPGEYRFIFGAFIDSKQQSVLIPDIDRPKVYEYSLTTDSLINSYERPDVSLRIQPIGNLITGVNFGEPSEEGLNILQCNSKFEVLDSLFIKDLLMIPFITIWAQSSTKGTIFSNDTLSVIDSGHLNPIVSINLGKYKLNETEARETIEGMIYSDEPDSEYLKRLNNFIIIRDFQFTDNNVLVTYIYGNNNYSDLYDMQSGKILNRFESEKDFNGLGRIVLENDTRLPLTVEKPFTKDSRWYGLSGINEPSESQSKQNIIVSFKI